MRISDWSSDVCSSDLIQQFIKRGVPRRLSEADRKRIARYFGVPESELGGSSDDGSAATLPEAFVLVPRFDVGASAGPGSRSEERRVGKECVSTCRSRGSPEHSKKKIRLEHILN